MSSIPHEITDTTGDRHTLEGKLARAEMSRRRATALGKAASASMYYAQTLAHIGFEADHAYTQAWEDRRRILSNQEPGPGAPQAAPAPPPPYTKDGTPDCEAPIEIAGVYTSEAVFDLSMQALRKANVFHAKRVKEIDQTKKLAWAAKEAAIDALDRVEELISWSQKLAEKCAQLQARTRGHSEGHDLL